ncbi:PAS domain S-box protein [Mucilaginibacter sp. UR6-1]|uniref:PAS domain-containing sensor histidine kinase n=1 Tax=Mucilaginibacter sp. UR6-1 TaxID=1435643 RepID=UPI001E578452|nr:PAS domain S-box protein [Mucilaginibacter sp. UR6-1]MCC8407897.1 PAS domain S-box protein [Mucilaginibacter sp. UR6-1]
MNNDVYKIVSDQDLAGFWEFDIRNVVWHVSESFKKMLGYGSEQTENLPDTWQKLVLDEDWEMVRRSISLNIENSSRQPFDITPRFKHRNGSIRWINCKGNVVEWDEQYKPVRLVGINVDVTRHILAEQELTNNKELLNKTNLSIKLGGWEIDMINKKLAWTQVTKQLYGVDVDFVPSFNIIDRFYKSGKHQQMMDKALTDITETGEPFDVETIMMTAQNDEKWVRIIAHAEFENGRCSKIYGTLQDIDDQVSIRHYLKNSEDRFESAFENSPIGMALVSPEGKWLKVNRILANSLGYNAEEFAALTFQEITHPDDLNTDLELLEKLVNGEISNYEMEKRYYHKNGNIIWALLSVSLVRDNDGKPLHFVSHVYDITEKKLQDEHIKQTLAIVGEQNNRLLNFAYIVSHNLRTHSGNFQSLIELVNDPNTDAEERQLYLTFLENVSIQLNETILNLNDVVSIQANRHLQKVPVNIFEYITKTIDALKPDIHKHQVLIKNEVTADAEIDFHPAYLESILLNLFTNSIKYRSIERQPVIVINFNILNNKKLLTVSDNGSGIDLSKYGNDLFGMYKTFHGNHDARGIGLFITKNQIEAMDGKIEVESQTGVGTSFKIYLPKN